MNKQIKIANGQGFWGDSIDAPIELINNGQIDYLTLDYLAEVTLSIMQKQKLKNPNHGYAKDFLKLAEKIIDKILKNNIKIITNAGGVNPKACRNELMKIAKNKSSDIKIGIIEGDDIISKIKDFRKKGVNFTNIDTGEDFEKIKDNLYSANVYIDSFPIAEALDMGAQIVLAGRVSDPGLVLGPCIHEFQWNRNQYNRLASGTLAGHIVECGCQCSGGNYTRWKDIKDFINIGYPIANINKNGNFSIMKHKKTGGIINKATVSEQILYEMGDPNKYISPDVCVDFTSFNINDESGDKVHIRNVSGFKPTDTYKVSMSYFGGYKTTGQLTISGPDALEKAELCANIVWGRLEKAGYIYSDKSTEYLGVSSCHKEIQAIPKNINEVVLRLGVRDFNINKVNRFGMEIAPLITSGPPGVTGFAGGRPKAQEIIDYWPALIPKDLIKTKVSVL